MDRKLESFWTPTSTRHIRRRWTGRRHLLIDAFRCCFHSFYISFIRYFFFHCCLFLQIVCPAYLCCLLYSLSMLLIFLQIFVLLFFTQLFSQCLFMQLFSCCFFPCSFFSCCFFPCSFSRAAYSFNLFIPLAIAAYSSDYLFMIDAFTIELPSICRQFAIPILH